MKDIISYFPKDEFKEISNLFLSQKNITFSGCGSSSSKAIVLSEILRSKKCGNVIWVVSEDSLRGAAEKAIKTWSDANVYSYVKRADEELLSFPTSRDFERVKKIELVEFVSRIESTKGSVFIVDFNSLLQNFPDANDIKNNCKKISVGADFDPVELIEEMVSDGYEVSDENILKKGQYCRKADSVFIYPVNFNNES